MVKSRCRNDTSAVGTARMPTVQISSRLRATTERPWASYQAPAVIPSHSVARGACHGASTGTSAASTSSLRRTSSSSLQFRREPGVKLVLAQHARAGQLVGRLSLVVLWVGLHTEFGRQGEHPLMGV